jgi:hypothetical protein
MVACGALLGVGLWDAPPARGQNGAGVFTSETPLTLTLRTDMRALLRDRGEERRAHTALIRYAGADGRTDSLPAELRTRGIFRRRPSICPFPPLRLDIRPRDARGTMFAGDRRFKLVTHCRSNDLYEQYVLQEYLIYRIYALLTDLSLRTRLARITYEDVTGREEPVTRYSFLIEHEGRLADRHGMRVVEDTGAPIARLDPQHTVFMAVFQYFIGNTDWSVRALHNIILFADSAGRLVPVPYDFDWSGVIATRYARPDTSLNIRSVEQRLYAGYCGAPEEFAEVFGRFREKRAAIEALYNLEPLDREHRERALRYYESFFRMIDDPRRVQREMLSRCGG